MESDFNEILDWISNSRRREYDKTIQRYPELKEKMCNAGHDGECNWEHCPQLRDNEPINSGRHCPLPHWTDNPEY